MLIEPNTRRTFLVTGCPHYRTWGGVPVTLPYDFLAASALVPAMVNGCDEIKIEIKGFRTRTYSLGEVCEMARNDRRFWHLLRPPDSRMALANAALLGG